MADGPGRGGELLATLPSLLGVELLRGLASAALPLAAPEMPMYMLWHRRHQDDPVQRWLRAELEAVAAQVLAAVSPVSG